MSLRIHSEQVLGVPIHPSTREGDDVEARLGHFIEQSTVFLLVKGTPQRPSCGFSATVIDIFNRLGSPYATFDVLSDPTIRAGAKSFSSWPTFPQIYVGGEFLGGADIAIQMYEDGELEGVVKEAIASHGPGGLHGSDTDAASASDASSSPSTAAQASGPGKSEVVEIGPAKLKLMGLEHFFVVDVREPEEATGALFAGSMSVPMGQLGMRYEELPSDSNLLLVSQQGERARRAGEFLIAKGHRHVYFLSGGVEAWSES